MHPTKKLRGHRVVTRPTELQKKAMFRKVILLLDFLLIHSFDPTPLLSMWNLGCRFMNIVKLAFGIILGVSMMYTMFIPYVVLLHSHMKFYCLRTEDDLMVIHTCRCIMAVVVFGMSEINVLLLCIMHCGIVTKVVWIVVTIMSRREMFFLDTCTLLVKVILKYLCKLIESKFLVYTGIWDSTCKGTPKYSIDTTQRHYPRKRIRWLFMTHGYQSKGLLASLFLSDNQDDDNGIEEGGDIPDVEELPGNHCICSYIMRLQPQDEIYSFVVYFCKCREDDAFYELCSAFDIPENIRVKIATNNSSMVIRCFDALHRVYRRDNELTLTTVKTRLSECSDELKQIVSDYDMNE